MVPISADSLIQSSASIVASNNDSQMNENGQFDLSFGVSSLFVVFLSYRATQILITSTSKASTNMFVSRHDGHTTLNLKWNVLFLSLVDHYAWFVYKNLSFVVSPLSFIYLFLSRSRALPLSLWPSTHVYFILMCLSPSEYMIF